MLSAAALSCFALVAQSLPALVTPSQHARACGPVLCAAPQPKAVVVGGGWAGFGAAWGLAQRGWDVTVLEASDKAVGGLAAGWTGPDGRNVELGM